MDPDNRLSERAAVLSALRGFLSTHQCTEVTTPVLRPCSVTDPHIESVAAFGGDNLLGFLQTSPEYAMKQLLARGSGDIWQLGPVFRSGESGRLHETEFTMLEWYRCGWRLTDLMEEVVHLARTAADQLGAVADNARKALATLPERRTYRSLFERRFGCNPHVLDTDELRDLCTAELGALAAHIHPATGRSGYLDALFSQLIEPSLQDPTFVTEFPIEQAALARVTVRDGNPVALRFEFYWRGIELANGYDELDDSQALRTRFIDNNRLRRMIGAPEMSLDDGFLSLIDQLPGCVGVAMGVDRLHLVLVGARDLEEVNPCAVLK